MICNDIIVNGISPAFLLQTDAWKQFSVMETLTIPVQKPDMKRITSLNIEAQITSYEVVRTPITKPNAEGIISTGYKLIVKGQLVQVIEYVADCCEQYAHSAHFEVPFYTYIVLPDNFLPGNSIKVDAIVEDVYVNQLSKRSFFKNVTVLAYATICCGTADIVVPLPLVTSTTPGVTITQPAPYVYNVSIPQRLLPEVILISSTPPRDVVLTNPLPPGYSYASGNLIVTQSAADATLFFMLENIPCPLPFTVNIDIVPSVKITFEGEDGVVPTGELGRFEFTANYIPQQGLNGKAIFNVSPYEVLKPQAALPTGYSYSNNVVTIDPKAASATLSFSVGEGVNEEPVTLTTKTLAPVEVTATGNDVLTVTKVDPYTFNTTYTPDGKTPGEINFTLDPSETLTLLSTNLPAGYSYNELKKSLTITPPASESASVVLGFTDSRVPDAPLTKVTVSVDVSSSVNVSATSSSNIELNKVAKNSFKSVYTSDKATPGTVTFALKPDTALRMTTQKYPDGYSYDEATKTVTVQPDETNSAKLEFEFTKGMTSEGTAKKEAGSTAPESETSAEIVTLDMEIAKMPFSLVVHAMYGVNLTRIDDANYSARYAPVPDVRGMVSFRTTPEDVVIRLSSGIPRGYLYDTINKNLIIEHDVDEVADLSFACIVDGTQYPLHLTITPR